ncbi:hypothetical protein OSB04_019959 [Centaurea solstitialis]|uniref:Integrase zinc-binding domain-containing protein n=1 Tax=Centaurea solstitialis TaxID=347529 RepID=A0AA38WGD3_9ASTR|nr:hypothetical protein OSB04_019959 [Centaurea solstitialis]
MCERERSTCLITLDTVTCYCLAHNPNNHAAQKKRSTGVTIVESAWALFSKPSAEKNTPAKDKRKGKDKVVAEDAAAAPDTMTEAEKADLAIALKLSHVEALASAGRTDRVVRPREGPSSKPAVEETSTEILLWKYADRDNEPPYDPVLTGMPNVDGRYKFALLTLKKEQVFSNIPLVELNTIMPRTLINKSILYSKYVVKRNDGNIYAFSDADLHNLCVYDLLFLHRIFSKYVITRKTLESRKTYADSLNRLREVMRAQEVYHSQTDFNIGMWLGQERLYISPSLNRPIWILRTHSKTIVYNPMFFNPYEWHKYTAESLAWIYKLMAIEVKNCRINRDEAKPLFELIEAQASHRFYMFNMYLGLKADGINDFPNSRIKEARSISQKTKFTEVYRRPSQRTTFVQVFIYRTSGRHDRGSDDPTSVKSNYFYTMSGMVPVSCEARQTLLDEAHKSKFSIHPGATKMYRDLETNYWWPRLKRDVAEYVEKCLTYLRVKVEHQRPHGKLQP